MFATALQEVTNYTHPVIASIRYFSGDVESGCAAFIILNRDGWILTASHVLEGLLLQQQHTNEIAEYEAAKALIDNNSRLSAKQKRREIGKIRSNAKWITHLSHWWGRDGVNVRQITGNKLMDVAVAQLAPFDPDSVQVYPTFWNPQNEVPPGTSLCRMGFPFHEVKASFDETTSQFILEPGTLPVPRFPLDGMHTRIAMFVEKTTGRQVKFIEVSTPGLRGQSGGPIFDVRARICGIQSRTKHLPLGFSPKLRRGSREIEEHQFLNVGLGAHVEEVINFLQEQNISVNIAES